MANTIERTGHTAPLTEEDLTRIKLCEITPDIQLQASVLIYSRDGIRVVSLVEGQSVVVGRAMPATVAIRDSSLSREHARLFMQNGEVWVEDLNSTNGTRIGGQKIHLCRVTPGTKLSLGAVFASVHAWGALESQQCGIESHDRFLMDLNSEVSRTLIFNHSLTLLMVRGGSHQADSVDTWLPRIRQCLRPFDRLALYSGNTLEILLPETSAAQARQLAEGIIGCHDSLVCGLAVAPDHGRSADELIEVARKSSQRANPDSRIASPESAGGDPGGAPTCCDTMAVVHSQAMQEVFRLVWRLASTSIPVLLQGETGTGKEVVARAIHEGGRRKDGPLICVNCAAISPQLLETTLFGHEKGSFTGASNQSEGVFEAADGGTILLDEIGDLPPAAQAALLRVIETKRFSRVGSCREIEVDVRILASTNRDLRAMCEAKLFREDLLFRLDTMTLELPPLRDRPSDIEPLVQHFMTLANRSNDCQVERIAPIAMDLLRSYPWPGNVRELRNAIERAVVISRGMEITPEDLPERIRSGDRSVARHSCGQLSPSGTIPAVPGPDRHQHSASNAEISLRSEVERFEAELIVEALRMTNWNRKLAAKQLDLPLSTLAHKMRCHGITRSSTIT